MTLQTVNKVPTIKEMGTVEIQLVTYNLNKHVNRSSFKWSYNFLLINESLRCLNKSKILETMRIQSKSMER